MEIDVGVEVLLVEPVDLGGEALRDMVVAEDLADDSGVFRFGEGVVVAVSGARLGQVDAEFLEELRDPAIDVLGAVVGMESEDGEREGFQ